MEDFNNTTVSELAKSIDTTGSQGESELDWMALVNQPATSDSNMSLAAEHQMPGSNRELSQVTAVNNKSVSKPQM